MSDSPKFRVGPDPEIVTSLRVRAFYDHWLTLRGDRRFPAKSEFDVTAVPQHASGLVLLKVSYDPLDFEYRIIGDDIVSRLGNAKGRRVRDAVLVNVGSSAYANYCDVVATGQPQFLEGVAVSGFPDDRPRRLSRVHCPLSADGETVDHIISYATFID